MSLSPFFFFSFLFVEIHVPAVTLPPQPTASREYTSFNLRKKFKRDAGAPSRNLQFFHLRQLGRGRDWRRAGSCCGKVTGSQERLQAPLMPQHVDNVTDQLWLCCFINSISRIQLAALLLALTFTYSVYKGRWEWCKSREREREPGRGGNQSGDLWKTLQ